MLLPASRQVLFRLFPAASGLAGAIPLLVSVIAKVILLKL